MEQEAIQRNSTTKGIQLAIIGLNLTYKCACAVILLDRGEGQAKKVWHRKRTQLTTT